MTDSKESMEHSFKKGPLPVALTLDHVSPVTRLLEKRKQMRQVQDSLDAQKDEYSRKEELFKRREENLRKKDLELQEALVLFNRFLKENEHKRRRADHRATEETKKTQKHEEEIALKRQILEQKKREFDRLTRRVAKNEKYTLYLQAVYDDNSNHFENEIQSIIARYQTLMQTHENLLGKVDELASQYEAKTATLNQKNKEHYNTTLSLNNQIANLSSELERAVKVTSEVEESTIRDENERANCERQISEINMATINLYNRAQSSLQRDKGDTKGAIQHAIPKLGFNRPDNLKTLKEVKEECNTRLDVILLYVLDFQAIYKDVKGAALPNGRGGFSVYARSHTDRNHDSHFAPEERPNPRRARGESSIKPSDSVQRSSGKNSTQHSRITATQHSNLTPASGHGSKISAERSLVHHPESASSSMAGLSPFSSVRH